MQAKTNVCVSGGTGFVGRAVIDALLQSGLNVTAALRRPDNGATLPCDTIVVGDIDGDTAWQTALARADVVVHLAAFTHQRDTAATLDAMHRVNVEGSTRLAQAAVDAGVTRFIYMSSIKVNGERSPVDETGKLHRLSGSDRAAPTTHYGRSKWLAEQGLQEIAREAGTSLIVLRPPIVYGPGQKANMQALFRLVDKRVPLPFANIDNRRSLIYVGNLADAVVCAAQTDHELCESFTLADVDISTPDLIRAIARALGRSPRLLPFPLAGLAFLAKLAGRREDLDKLTGSLLVEHERIESVLGWRPQVSFPDALTKTAHWYRASNGAA